MCIEVNKHMLIIWIHIGQLFNLCKCDQERMERSASSPPTSLLWWKFVLKSANFINLPMGTNICIFVFLLASADFVPCIQSCLFHIAIFWPKKMEFQTKCFQDREFLRVESVCNQVSLWTLPSVDLWLLSASPTFPLLITEGGVVHLLSVMQCVQCSGLKQELARQQAKAICFSFWTFTIPTHTHTYIWLNWI